MEMPLIENGDVSARFLVVDDDPLARRVARRMLKPLGGHVETAESVAVAREKLAEAPVGLVLTDLRLPEEDGAALLEHVRRSYPAVPVVMMTSHGSIEVAVGLMKRGAADFITKPLEASTLLPRVELALQRAALANRVESLERQLAAATPGHRLVGDGEAMRTLRERIGLAGRSGAVVLVSGETGTGKELVARALHAASDRAEGPFVAVNCGALPGELLESELFGHAKGAFTGATADRPGLVREAAGGTLFLDEVGDMPLPLQVKLLRFLQEGEVRPVGAGKPVRVDARVVAATHRDLRAAVADGEFREDLYYRLDVVRLRGAPLRERAGDIALLADHFLRRFAAGTSRPALRLSDDGGAALCRHPWPGNVRELENVLRRAVVFADGEALGAADLDLDRARHGSSAPGPAIDRPFKDAKARATDLFERGYVEAQLAAAAGNVSEAARRSGKDRKSFWTLVRRLGVEPDDFRP